MNEKEVIRRVMKAKGVTQEELRKMCGYTSQGVISNLLNRSKSMRVDILVRMLDLMGYDVMVFDRESGEKIGKLTSKVTSPKKYKKGEKKVEESEEVVETTEPVEKTRVEIPVFQYGK